MGIKLFVPVHNLIPGIVFHYLYFRTPSFLASILHLDSHGNRQRNWQGKDEHEGRKHDIQGTPLISQPRDGNLKLALQSVIY
jgi:hypothetical protein